MWPLDALDWALSLPYRELRGLPPNHMRIRVGVGNRILFNGAQFRLMPINFWIDALAAGHVTLESRIVDLGCGCGRYAMALRDFWFHERKFEGEYFGVDVDDEMLAWCRGHFPPERFAFHKVQVYSRTYNPHGGEDAASALDASGDAARLNGTANTPHATNTQTHAIHASATSASSARPATRWTLPLPDASRDFVFANSLFSHLLEEDFLGYLRESARLLRPSGWMHFSVFCLEHVDRKPGSRWSFQHRDGAAHVESTRYPEAAVAYELAWLERACREAGFSSFEALSSTTQTMIRVKK